MEFQFLNEFFASPAGAAVLVVAIAAVADFAFGVFGAVRDDVFEMDAVAAWLRKHLMGRVAPILTVLLLGAASGGVSISDGVGGIVTPGGLFTGIGALAAVTYVLEVVASVRQSLVPQPDVREVPEE